VRTHRIDARCLVAGLASLLLVALTSGCATPEVGAPCLPEQIPDTGFDDREAYIESSSVQCETRVCIVYRLDGDPRDGCVASPPEEGCTPGDTSCSQGKKCSEPADVEDRIYCSCRCNSADTGFAECECPDGFSCVDLLDQGGPGVRGGYCVKNGTFSKN